MITFNKPFLTGKEVHYIYEAVYSKKLSGNGDFTKRCHAFFENRYSFEKCLLTTSCTDALEMCALLLDIKEGDEVIMPSYTFVSTANAFILHGAKIVFADSLPNNPNMDISKLPSLISAKTKAIVVVHYAGVACDMDPILALAKEHNLFVIEDAAQAVDSFYKGRPLGSIGDAAAFSFHETKNIISGEGGMLVVNNNKLAKRAEVIWEKGTNRSAFFRGEIDKYGWVDKGSSFLPSEIIAAFLFAQLENLDMVQDRRKAIWHLYHENLLTYSQAGFFSLPDIPKYATNNAHMFYLVCRSEEERTALISYLRSSGIHAVFHYLSLHDSPYFKDKYHGGPLDQCKKYENCLVRLPLYFELKDEEVLLISQKIGEFFNSSLSNNS